MTLATHNPIGFIPTTNPATARRFFAETLGLTLISEDQFALVFHIGPHHQMLRVTIVPSYTPLPFTIFGWEVSNLAEVVTQLTAAGVGFQRYSFLPQDDLGIWTAPSGSQIAWFHDPEGNILSLSKHD